MSIEINLPPSLQPLAGDAKQVQVSGRTVGDCLKELVRRYPPLRKKLFSARGKLLNSINIFINSGAAPSGVLSGPVKDGDIIHIFIPVLGG